MPRLVPRVVALSAGKYEMTREKVEFSQYMREEGYHIIPIKPEHQLVSPIFEQAEFAHHHCMVVVCNSLSSVLRQLCEYTCHNLCVYGCAI